MVDKDMNQQEEVLMNLGEGTMPPEPSMDGDEGEDMESFQELYEQSLVNIQEGEVIHGKIIQITEDFVMVDIGYKSEGQIRIHEFKDENGAIQAAVGDEVDALLEYREDDDGAIILSKDKAEKIKIWDDISQIYNNDGVIDGTVVSKVKGGLAVDIGIQAFLPGSQVDLRPVRNLESLINQTFSFKILKYNKKRRNVVLSRRALLEKERDSMKAQTLAELEEGKIVEGTVKNITDYGVFVDLGGIDGLLHIAAQIRARDQADEQRSLAPLRPAADALLLDTSAREPAEVVSQLLAFYTKKQQD